MADCVRRNLPSCVTCGGRSLSDGGQRGNLLGAKFARPDEGLPRGSPHLCPANNRSSARRNSRVALDGARRGAYVSKGTCFLWIRWDLEPRLLAKTAACPLACIRYARRLRPNAACATFACGSCAGSYFASAGSSCHLGGLFTPDSRLFEDDQNLAFLASSGPAFLEVLGADNLLCVLPGSPRRRSLAGRDPGADPTPRSSPRVTCASMPEARIRATQRNGWRTYLAAASPKSVSLRAAHRTWNLR